MSLKSLQEKMLSQLEYNNERIKKEFMNLILCMSDNEVLARCVRDMDIFRDVIVDNVGYDEKNDDFYGIEFDINNNYADIGESLFNYFDDNPYTFDCIKDNADVAVLVNGEVSYYIFKINSRYYKLEYNYDSYNGRTFNTTLKNFKEVFPIKKTVTYYE